MWASGLNLLQGIYSVLDTEVWILEVRGQAIRAYGGLEVCGWALRG